MEGVGLRVFSSLHAHYLNDRLVEGEREGESERKGGRESIYTCVYMVSYKKMLLGEGVCREQQKHFFKDKEEKCF